ncbi:MAG TPA: FHA domain-containing protein [Gemmatimonadaceae bacterium]|nr:FHA domain-containing protein [Gemmatimonadaceae bacterium]
MILLALGAIVLLGGALAARRRRKRVQALLQGDHPPPMLVAYPPALVGAAPVGARHVAPERTPGRSGDRLLARVDEGSVAGAARGRAPFRHAVAGREVADGATVRIQRPAEDTVQVLPGRLEVVEGEEQREIRFVRAWGDVPEITIGRGTGPKHRHLQLHSLTVSRAHARMRFEGERWKIVNLSETNPTLVNGTPLGLGETRLLSHGDRLELGEILLRFWEH